MSSVFREVLAGTLILVSIGGCGERGQSTTGSEFVERDSAGVRIIENPWVGDSSLYALDAPWKVVQRIGRIEGDPAYLLYRLGTVLLLPSQELVAQTGTELRFFDGDGLHVKTVGRSGAGPGEYQSIAGLVLERDTLFVFDERLSRVSFLSLDGTYVGGFSIPIDFFEVVGLPPRLAAAPDEGQFVFLPAGFIPPERESEGLVRSYMPIVAVSRTERAIDTLAFLGTDWLTGDRQRMGVPFGRRASAAANASRLVMTDGQAYELEVRDVTTGGIESLIRIARDPPALSRSEFREGAQDYLTRAAAGQTGARAPPSARDQARRMLEPLIPEEPPYDTKPAWTQVLCSRDGKIWAQRYLETGDSLRAFDVFDSTGRLVGSTLLPISIRVTDIVEDRVAGVVRDSLDVQYAVELQVSIEPDGSTAPLGGRG